MPATVDADTWSDISATVLLSHWKLLRRAVKEEWAEVQEEEV
jgi:hypothetical protein